MLERLSGENDHHASRGSPLRAFGRNSGLRRRAGPASSDSAEVGKRRRASSVTTIVAGRNAAAFCSARNGSRTCSRIAPNVHRSIGPIVGGIVYTVP